MPQATEIRCQNHTMSILGGQGGAKCRFRILLEGFWGQAVFFRFFEASKISQNLIKSVFCSLLDARGACRSMRPGSNPPPTPPVWSLRSSRNFQRLELKLFLAFRHLVRAAYNRPPTPPVLSLRSARNFSRAASRCSRAFRHLCSPGPLPPDLPPSLQLTLCNQRPARG